MLFKYNIFGYDKNGYNRQGFDRQGYDHMGYNKDGFDRNGYDRNGFDKNGFDKQGYNSKGLNSQGFYRSGYNEDGFNIDGYDLNGFDKNGYDRNGFDKNGFDEFGYNEQGLNINGYDKNGFDVNGFDKYGFDRQGYDFEGYNKLGIDKAGYHKEGTSSNSKATLIAEETSNEKQPIEYEQIKQKTNKNDILLNLITNAYNTRDKEKLFFLGDAFYSGLYCDKDYDLAKQIYDLAKGIKTNENEKYYTVPEATDFLKENNKDSAFNKEKIHLETTKQYIDDDIKENRKGIKKSDSETWWMDFDQRDDWKATSAGNRRKLEKINLLEHIKRRPYYARMDLQSTTNTTTCYIGEEPYFCKDEKFSILSVWSEIGKKYREKRISEFSYNDYTYKVLLRRNLDIRNGNLIEIYDEYDVKSKTTKENITDLYLLRILQEKKNEKNITNIIRSIQLNQNEIIEYDFKKNLLVQGCAGSGKTMILLHRLANMKYNNPNMDYSKIKIITPNKNFNFFIDELSKNLHIEKINKMTIAEYWADVIYRYRIQSHGTDNKDYIANNDDFTSVREKSIIYSNEFAKKLIENVDAIIEKNLKYQKTISEYEIDEFVNKKRDNHGKLITKVRKGAEEYIDRALDYTFKYFDLSVSSKDHFACVLYSKVLAIYQYYGKSLIKKDTLICIDEGQDVSILQYSLIMRINDNSAIFNIYGDINQQLKCNCNIDAWDTLLKHIDAKKFELNENYRNSEEIVDFYNNKLEMNNTSFGLKTKPVIHISESELTWKVVLSLLLGHNTAIIVQDKNCLPKSIRPYCVYNDVTDNTKAVVLNVKQAKGLEYHTVFVYDYDLNKNEKYISYTRALSELIIVDK